VTQSQYQNKSQKLMAKLKESDLRSQLSTIWARHWEIIIAAVAAFIVSGLILLVR
jgi:LPS O-antigen subunit length determinant protein (WzzB/FepE family)